MLFKPGVASALDNTAISESRDAGTRAAFDRRVDGRTLDLEPRGKVAVDRQTGTCLTVALNEAVRQGLVPRNPCLGVPALPAERQELEYLRMHENGAELHS